MMLNKLFGSNKIIPSNHEPYFRSLLSANHKTVYDTLVTGIKACQDKIQIANTAKKDLLAIFVSILKDYPIIFYTTKYQWTTTTSSPTMLFEPEYLYDKNTIKKYTDTIQNYLKNFDRAKNMNDYEKELFVHDYCLKNFTYDYNFSESSYSAHGLVLYKTAVCEGIAEFTKLALDYLGVPCLVVYGRGTDPTGKSKTESHAWNIVEIGGKTYHLDVTYDMTTKDKRNRYDYFNLTDTDIKKDHIIEDKVPTCNTTTDNYLSKNNMIVNKLSELDAHLTKHLRTGNKTVMFKLLNERFSNKLVDNILEIATQTYLNIYKGSVSASAIYNSNQMVFEIEFKDSGNRYLKSSSNSKIE